MRMPIKLSREAWPGWLTAVLPSRADPGALVRAAGAETDAPPAAARAHFSRCASGLVEGGVWRSTAPGRHAHTHALIARIPEAERAVMLEIGASDGVTSLELIEALGGRFARLWVTDRRLSVRYWRRDGRVYFYDEHGRCLLVSCPRLLAYASPGGWFPFRWWARSILASAPDAAAVELQELPLVQPELRALAARDGRVALRAYDLSQPWDGGPVDLIKVANLLNRAYFSAEVLRRMLAHLAAALRPGGRLIVIDNRAGCEHASVLRRTADGFALADQVGNGAEAAALALAAGPAPVAPPAGGAPRAAGRPADIAIWGRVPPPIGGMSVHVERLLPHLARAGLTVRMYNLQSPGPPHPLMADVSRRRLAWFLGQLLGRGERVHYVLGGRTLTRFAAGLLAALRGRKIVLRVGGESLRRSGRESGFLAHRMIRFAVRRAAAVIGVNPEICELARGLGARPERVHHIPGFIPPPPAPGEAAPEAPVEVRRFAQAHRPVIVSGGQIPAPGEPDLYGTAQLVEIMPRVRETFPRAGLVFFAYQVRARGDELRRELVAEIERCGLSDCILVYPSQGEFWPVLTLADLMVRPTLTDGDSNALREALHFGVPTVASACAPRPEGVRTYPTGDAAALARLVVELLSAASPEGSGGTACAPAGQSSAAREPAGRSNAARVVALLQELARSARTPTDLPG